MNMDEFDSLLLELITCRPVTRDIDSVNRVADRIAAFASEHGLFCTTENIGGRHTVFAATEAGKKPDLLLNAHIDVVPAIEEKQYTPEIKDGILYARGAGDCLGNAVTILRFLCSWKKRNSAISAGGVFSADEETGGASTEGMMKRGYAAKQMILVLDSWLNGDICCAQKGILSLKLTAQGKGGHSSKPWGLVNPIDRLTDAYLRLRSVWENPSSEEDWRNSMTPCVLRAGAVENQVPDTAEMVLNFRYVRDADRVQILDLVREQTGLRHSSGVPPRLQRHFHSGSGNSAPHCSGGILQAGRKIHTHVRRHRRTVLEGNGRAPCHLRAPDLRPAFGGRRTGPEFHFQADAFPDPSGGIALICFRIFLIQEYP